MVFLKQLAAFDVPGLFDAVAVVLNGAIRKKQNECKDSNCAKFGRPGCTFLLHLAPMVIVRIRAVYEMSRVELRVDNELIGRCLDGDQAAWRELVQKYQRLVYSVARTVCPQTEDVPDVFQQVWMELYQQLSALRHIEALPAWLITVTKRKAYA